MGVGPRTRQTTTAFGLHCAAGERRMLSRVGFFRRGFASLAVKNLKLETAAPLAAVGKDQVAIAMVASPVHAADIKSAAGAVGIEGVGKITAVGAGVSHLRAGDWVVPKLGFGAWRSEAVLDAASVTRVREHFALEQCESAPDWSFSIPSCRVCHVVISLTPSSLFCPLS